MPGSQEYRLFTDELRVSPLEPPQPASLTIARKLARRSFHVLRELGPAALEPVPSR